MIYQVSFQPPSLEVLQRHADGALRDIYISERWCLGTWLSGGSVRLALELDSMTLKVFSNLNGPVIQ